MAEQKDLMITIGRNFDEIRRVSIIVAEEKGVADQYREILNKLLRTIDQLELLEEAIKHNPKNGCKLPVSLKKELSEKYNFSEKTIERIVYGG